MRIVRIQDLAEARCKLALTLLEPGELCPACGSVAGAHRNHPYQRKCREERERAANPIPDDILVRCMSVLVAYPGAGEWNGEGRLLIDRATVDAKTGSLTVGLTPLSYVFKVEPSPEPDAKSAAE